MHVVTISTKGQLLVASASGGAPACPLSELMASAAQGVLPCCQVVSWLDKRSAAGSSGGGGVRFSVVLRDSVEGSGHAEKLVQEAVLQTAQASMGSDGGDAWVFIDADDSQATVRPGVAGGDSVGAEDPVCLFAAVAHRFGRRCLAMVQNVHFLPFGPSGTSRRAPALMRAWSLLGGVICVSRFVSEYLEKWAPPGTLTLSGAEESHGTAAERPARGGGGPNTSDGPLSCELTGPASSSRGLLFVPLSAWRCFGSLPFPDFGAAAADRMRHRRLRAEGVEPVNAASSCTESLRPATVGCLKLTPEKGCSIVFELARRMPHLRFLAVAGDPQVSPYCSLSHPTRMSEGVLPRPILLPCAFHNPHAPHSPKVFEAASGLTNVELVEPVSDVDALMRRMDVVIAPSLWLEAWGMVVTEATLRGLPTVISDSGEGQGCAGKRGLSCKVAKVDGQAGRVRGIS